MKFITEQMAVKNLRRRPVRTWCMIFFVFMLSAALFLSSVLVESMQGSLQKTVDRMGADVIVVPEEYEREMADSLFLGELCDFTFDSRWVDRAGHAAAVHGVAGSLLLLRRDPADRHRP